jgi:hypothetical protein
LPHPRQCGFGRNADPRTTCWDFDIHHADLASTTHRSRTINNNIVWGP